VLPDFEMLNEHGRTARLAEFRGQAVAFSLFFTRCPLPDFCPLMNKNFSEARRLLLADQSAMTNWNLLSLSFDAEFDSPAMLAGYARSYRGDDASHWLFANASPATLTGLAPKIDFMFARDSGGFSHNLRTVVLDTQGRVQHIFNGNKWTATELVEEMKRAMQAKP
jgi:protein SCO1/2